MTNTTATATKLRNTTTASTTGSDIPAPTPAGNASTEEVRLGICTFVLKLMQMQYCYGSNYSQSANQEIPLQFWCVMRVILCKFQVLLETKQMNQQINKSVSE